MVTTRRASAALSDINSDASSGNWANDVIDEDADFWVQMRHVRRHK